MATKGSFKKTYTNNSAFTATLSWTAKQNIPGNYSDVTATLVVKSNASWAIASGWVGITSSITINGSTKNNNSVNHNISGNKSKTIQTATVRVNHGSNGKKSFSLSFKIKYGKINWNGSYINTISASGSGTLNDIPRSSSASIPTSVTIGSSFNINIKAASSSMKHSISMSGALGSSTLVSNSSGGGNKSVTIPTSTLSKIPKSTKATIKIKVDTLSGSSVIGSVSQNVTANVNSSVKPSVSSLSSTDTSNSSTKLGLSSNSYIANSSTVKLTSSASGVSGSSIVSYFYSLGNSSITNKSSSATFKSTDIRTPGSVSASVTVTDSRGRTASKSISLSVLDYSIPNISKYSVVRTKTGTDVELNKNVIVSSVGGKNTYTTKLNYKKHDETKWEKSLTLSNSTNKYTYSDISLDHQYDFQLVIEDKLSVVTETRFVIAGPTLFMMKKDEGVGIGKRWEHGTLDVGGKAYFEGQIITSRSIYASKGGALNMNNSDIVGANAIWIGSGQGNIGTKDPANNDGEGIMFPHSDYVFTPDDSIPDSNGGHADWDAFRVQDGIGYLNSVPIISTPMNATLNYQSGWANYSGPTSVVVKRNGNIVTVHGVVKNSNEIPANGTNQKIAKLPAWAVPSQEVFRLTQASGSSIVLIVYTSDGYLSVTRPRSFGSSGYSKLGTNQWLHVGATYIV